MAERRQRWCSLTFPDDASLHRISFREALGVWTRVAAYSFGGPAGQIAVMQRILVDEKRWFSPNRFLHAMNYTMLLPGPEAQQLATYGGWMLHGWRGGLVAGGLFVLPGFLAILGLSVLLRSSSGSSRPCSPSCWRRWSGSGGGP